MLISSFPFTKIEEIKNVIEQNIFNRDRKIDYSSQSIEDLAHDRAIEFDAYYMHFHHNARDDIPVSPQTGL